MKRNLFAALLVLLIAPAAFSQAPESINYQAAVYDNDGNPISNQSVSVRFAILEGGATGPVTYEEEHTGILTTNQGLFNIRIGEGTSTGIGSAPDFASIDWGAANYFLRVESDAGQGYEILGVTQFVSVPYALYAKEAGSGGGSDADSDPSNELNESATLTGTELSITDAGGDVSVDLAPLQDGVNDADADPTNELQEWSSLPGIPSGFTDGIDNVNDADNDPANEIETWSTLSGIPGDFADGVDDVVDGDASATNEIQTLSLTGTTLTLSDGGGSISLPGDTDWIESGSDVYKTGGNVGIGTTSPTAPLDVNGNAVVNGNVAVNGATDVTGDVTANNFNYASPKTFYLSLPGSAFRPGHTANNPWAAYWGNGPAYMTDEVGGMIASFNLPDGARIVAIEFYFEDDAAEELSMALMTHSVWGGYSSLADYDSVTDTDGVQNYEMTLAHTVNNNGNGYLVRAYGGPWSSQVTGDELRFYGAKITYEMDETH